jgi:hypothetical protein
MNACAEQIDYRSARGLDKIVIRSLTKNQPASARTRTFSYLGQLASEKASLLVLWHRRRIAMVTLHFTLGPKHNSEISQWRALMGAYAVY